MKLADGYPTIRSNGQWLKRVFSFYNQVAETHFASNTIVLRRLVKFRVALCNMVINTNWVVWKQSSTERAKKTRERILIEKWWDLVTYLLSITEPIMSVIRYTDMDRPCIGEIYDGIDSMLEKIKVTIKGKENDPQEKFFKELEAIVVERWNKMTTPLHLLAYALTPKYYSNQFLDKPRRIPPWRDLEVSDGYKAAFLRLYLDDDLRDVVTSEFIEFANGNGLSVDALRHRSKKDAHSWWYFHGTCFQHLQPLAINFLSQVASSSASERNWSTYSFIHSVKRNRLLSKRAKNLVYVHSNVRLLSHKQHDYTQGEMKMWVIEPEHTDLDAPASQLLALTLDDSDIEPTYSASASGIVSSNVSVNEEEEEDELDDPSDD
ncbi:uncharacterized protein LOC131068603 [Cryptomeria japonica]|uniref:uncharacterized protein LOC131068603 n=1 Tax=Cryptomeria japonica TaxID=3369 RepID=UPI0027DA15D7|nr:uncharacterized protein LOC131068603 [Cryptomeria japonica]